MLLLTCEHEFSQSHRHPAAGPRRRAKFRQRVRNLQRAAESDGMNSKRRSDIAGRFSIFTGDWNHETFSDRFGIGVRRCCDARPRRLLFLLKPAANRICN